jgi:prepilin-type N-terminal cleavage/methylation domain-containing protein
VRGFSLIEVLVATAITMGVGAIVFQLFHQNERIFRDESLRMEMQQTARMIISQIGDDIRIAGQSVPPEMGEIILPGSSEQRLNLRAGFSATESIVTTPLPISLATGSSITLGVENTTGFTTGRQVYLWNGPSWIRATLDSVSGSAKTVRLIPSGAGSPVEFTTAPMIAPDEAIAVYRDAATQTVRRTTSTNTTNASSPAWAPANELATNVIGLRFLYYDAAGEPIATDTPAERVRIESIETRVQVRPAVALAGGAQPIYSLSVRFHPRNLHYR